MLIRRANRVISELGDIRNFGQAVSVVVVVLVTSRVDAQVVVIVVGISRRLVANQR